MLEKLGRHEQVLSIYVYRLNDIDRAIEYCDRVYASENENSYQVKSIEDFQFTYNTVLSFWPIPISIIRSFVTVHSI